ncbi:glycerate kinase [Desulfovibrio mangrovi]|uniref:glycerate kinase type-2 family protein n=1 Tax=Desulfovibrio mangrovi TaxID=2976983 RepID=UPI0022479465|nr:glycerate kinase [Desulfovibrio mangrovi]UZP69063.1 glycerate kinase [Desulfovibrio mangrovi]
MTAQRRDTLRAILDAALHAVAPDKAIHRHVAVTGSIMNISGVEYDLDAFERIFVVGAGKGAAPMAATLEAMLGDRITEGAVCVKYGHTVPTRTVSIYEGAHPVPDANGEQAARAILRIAEKATEKDLVLCVITGGASALTPALVEGISLEDGKAATALLLECGATIHEINAIRKHLSIFGSGNLARAASPARLAALIISDVVGDNLDVIASGPTSPDSSTFSQCMEIVERYGIRDRMPANILARLEAGARGEIPETPKQGDHVFSTVQNVLVATNLQALEAAAAAALQAGYTPRILTSTMTGEARDKARELVDTAMNLCLDGKEVSGPVCLLAGGETTVTITGKGLGGRNQEMALAASLYLQDCEHITMLCAGTDGSDGPTDAAGGFACSKTVEKALCCALDPQVYLDDNNAYNFLDKTDNLLKTGPTLTNVMDLALVLVDCPR